MPTLDDPGAATLYAGPDGCPTPIARHPASTSADDPLAFNRRNGAERADGEGNLLHWSWLLIAILLRVTENARRSMAIQDVTGFLSEMVSLNFAEPGAILPCILTRKFSVLVHLSFGWEARLPARCWDISPPSTPGCRTLAPATLPFPAEWAAGFRRNDAGQRRPDRFHRMPARRDCAAKRRLHQAVRWTSHMGPCRGDHCIGANRW